MPIQDQSVPILNITDKKISINTIALKKILTRVGNHHFAFYSINGPRRTGKSFMLNNFLRFLKAGENKETRPTGWLLDSFNSNMNDSQFQWRGGDERNTRGIDVWSEPFWVERDNKKIALLLMDTQGAFDDETTLQQNASIFAISTLLSSVLIFNIMRDITEDLLQFFELFSCYARLAEPSTESDCETFQNLIFLLRDYQFLKSFKYGYYDDETIPLEQTKNRGLNFKKERIDTKPDSQPIEIQVTRNTLKKSFKKIGAYLMPDPGKGLKHDDKVDKLDEDFITHVENFVHLILSKEVITKKIGGVEVTGIEMIKYVDAWAKCFEGKGVDGIPEIRGICQTTAEQQYLSAKVVAYSYYLDKMNGYLRSNPNGVQRSALEQKRDEVISTANKVYKGRRKLGGNEYDERFRQEFTDETNCLFETFIATNQANLNAEEIRREFEVKTKKIQEKIRETNAKMEALKDEHEEERRKLEEAIESGQKQASDMKDLMVEQEQRENENRTRLDEYEREIRNLRDQKENELQGIFAKIGKKVGEAVDNFFSGVKNIFR